ncbi:hypothetical protein [Lactococcus lactis]|uniref:hypothetical protein n=1 Tax=Lactococcus lactis TaxID=1358 RepID=UPI001F108512|nr:hypothetical protein [Lactococcus lactis]MCH5428897.1 hypothetical protein [Lactococcus lactis]
MMKRKKVILILTVSFSCLALFIGTLSFVGGNLGKYSIYYAQNLPHETGTNSVMTALFKHLGDVYIPYNSLDNDGNKMLETEDKTIHYQAGGMFSPTMITVKSTKDGDVLLSLQSDSQFPYCIYDFTENTYYGFNRAGTLVAEFIDSNTNVLSSHRVSALNTVNKLQNEMYGPIISHRKVPKINLQFIYNFVNEGKFK